jgi:hypothetical protein
MHSSGPRQCLIRPHDCAGVFSLVNKVITCMDLYPKVRVSFPPRETLFPRCTADVWSLMFEPFETLFDDHEDCDTIINYPHPAYTNRTAANTYTGKDGWRHRLHSQFSKLKVKPDVLELANTILPGRIQECIGVLYRGEKELAAEQRTGVISSPEAMCERINSVSRDGLVFVCADSFEANARFNTILGERMFFWEAGDRCELIGQTVHRGRGHGDEHVKKTLAMVLALSRTRHFVHAVSNMATAVLYINPWLPHTFVETPAT